MKIAVVGSGISGLTVTLCLKDRFDLTLFEKEARVGGHSNTIDLELDGNKTPVDTGFIVFNNKNYPIFSKLLEFLNVKSEWSDMSFGFSLNDGKMEYACDNLDKIFSQRSNFLKPKFIGGFLDVLRFQRESIKDLNSGKVGGLSLGAYLEKGNFSPWLKYNYLLPLGASIWSSSTSNILKFPAKNFIMFFRNHDLMTGLRPAQRWRTITGGARVYVDEIMSSFNGKVRKNTEVLSASRVKDTIALKLNDGLEEKFDHVIFCCNAPIANKILSSQPDLQIEKLKALRTSSNKCILHSDKTLMPKRKKVWSSWNFLSSGEKIDSESPVSVTYWMNRLQNIDSQVPILLSLNPRKKLLEDKVFGEFYYEHPIMNLESFESQKYIKSSQGKNNIWFAGAWLGNGFHEDGVVSALEVCKNFGELPEWIFDDNISKKFENLKAAE